MTNTLPNPARAGRAVGAMFFAVFGAAWLVFGAQLAFDTPGLFQAGAAALGMVLFMAAWRVFRRNAAALKQAPSIDDRRRSRVFNIVNAIQWVAIIVAVNVLIHLGLAQWIVPTIILIVGLHFLPLARLFDYRPHDITGAALIVLACSYPFLTARGPESPVGQFGAGLLLWASALWALKRPAS